MKNTTGLWMLEHLPEDLRYVGLAVYELWQEEKLDFWEYFALMDSLENDHGY